MPELRKDPIIDRWVIIAVERAKRPDNFLIKRDNPPEGECPFCHGKESLSPSTIHTIKSQHPTETLAFPKENVSPWDVRVIPSRTPFLRIEGELDRRGNGIYDVMNGVGAHEIIIETPFHIKNMAELEEEQIAKVLTCFADRIKDLERDTRFKYTIVYKNYGWAAGAGPIRHSRSQLIATPVTPKRIKEKLTGARSYYTTHERCIFCDLIKQEINEEKRVIMDFDGFVTIAPFASRFPFEMWIMPKKHSCDFYNIGSDNLNLAKILKKTLLKLKIGLNDPPYNLIINTAPFRREKSGYWQTINEDYHWHIEIIPRVTNVAGFEWGTGFYICPIPPEDAASYLREIS